MIKYRHRNCEKVFQPATFAYDLPSASLFKQMILESETLVTFPFGMTLVHERDMYNKATGREYALRAVKPTTFQLEYIKTENNRQYFVLVSINTYKDLVIKVSTDLKNSCRIDYIDFREWL